MNIKRIIAREGLIILGIIGVVGILLCINFLLPSDASYIYTCHTGKNKYKIESLEYYTTFNDEGKFEIFELLQKKFPNIFPEAKEGYRWMPSDLKIDYPVTRYTFLGHMKNALSNISLILFCFGYPFYWLIRFIIWAVKTLKEK